MERRVSTCLFIAAAALAGSGCWARVIMDGCHDDGAGGAATTTSSAPTTTQDAGAPPEKPECDPSFRRVFLVTAERELYGFDPTTGAFPLIGALDCPAQPGAGPFSMGVSRRGVAYVLYSSGELFKVDTTNARCYPTSFAPNQSGFVVFGMGFALDDGPTGEGLYVTEGGRLGRIEPSTLALSPVGPLSNNVSPAGDVLDWAELTSTDDGSLYGFFFGTVRSDDGGYFVRLDKTTGTFLEKTHLSAGLEGSLAFAHWGGSFYIFTGQALGGTTVTRYSPADHTETVVTELPRVVVGAGVSTCKSGPQ